jgi:myo-inositol-1(or 4)-monophosphatase
MKGYVMTRELDVAIKAAREAEKIVTRYYGKTTFSFKHDKSFVTKTDTESEEVIKSILRKEFPDYPVLGEESGKTGGESDYLWVVDPLDGTTNYTFRNPFFDISVALTYKNDPILGVVSYPSQGELFYAEKGKGAFLNETKIEVYSQMQIENSILTFCHGRDKDSVIRMIKAFSELKQINQKVRQLGAAALELCYVASGRVDAFFMTGMNSWDIAAGTVILREAGGQVTDFKGYDFNMQSHDILGTNGKMHKTLLNILQHI